MKVLSSLVAVALLSSFGTAQAQAGKVDEKADKKTCRDMGSPTGSILARKKLCHTRAEWAEIDKANTAGADRFQADRDRMRMRRD